MITALFLSIPVVLGLGMPTGVPAGEALAPAPAVVLPAFADDPQPDKPQIVDNPNGKGKMEFLGLKRHKAADIMKRLADLTPGQTPRICAADFRTKLGFADAAVSHHFDDNMRLYTVITLVEPEEATRVKYRPAIAAASLPAISEWKVGLELAANSNLLQALVNTYALKMSGKDVEVKKVLGHFGLKPEQVKPAWEFLAGRKSKRDHELAIWALDHHGDSKLRALAATLLLNFPDSDLTWWSLADALRDPDEFVSMSARQVLHALAKEHSRPVDWRPALASLRAVLGGTNLFSYTDTLEALTVTKIDPTLAGDLLPGNTELLAAYVKSQHQPSRDKALAFLKTLAPGQERSPDEWVKWLERLQQDKTTSR